MIANSGVGFIPNQTRSLSERQTIIKNSIDRLTHFDSTQKLSIAGALESVMHHDDAGWDLCDSLLVQLAASNRDQLKAANTFLAKGHFAVALEIFHLLADQQSMPGAYFALGTEYKKLCEQTYQASISTTHHNSETTTIVRDMEGFNRADDYFSKATKYLELALKAGVREVEFPLGVLYKNGLVYTGIHGDVDYRRDYAKAICYFDAVIYSKQLEHQNIARYYLGQIYLQMGQMSDLIRAAQYFHAVLDSQQLSLEQRVDAKKQLAIAKEAVQNKLAKGGPNPGSLPSKK